MKLTAALHSTLAASFLGTTIPAGTAGAPSLKIALDTLHNHPNVGPFLGRQMIQRLVTSNPSTGYVARVASAFNNNGAGVRGDLRAMFRAILLDEEGLLARTIIYATDVSTSALVAAERGVFALDRAQEFSRNYQQAGGRRSLSDYYTAAYDRIAFDRRLVANVVFSEYSAVLKS